MIAVQWGYQDLITEAVRIFKKVDNVEHIRVYRGMMENHGQKKALVRATRKRNRANTSQELLDTAAEMDDEAETFRRDNDTMATNDGPISPPRDLNAMDSIQINIHQAMTMDTKIAKEMDDNIRTQEMDKKQTMRTIAEVASRRSLPLPPPLPVNHLLPRHF